MASSRRAGNARIPRDKPADGWPAAVDAFLSQPGLAAQTRRSYRLTLAALTAALEAAGAEPSREAIEAAARLRWGRVNDQSGPRAEVRHPIADSGVRPARVRRERAAGGRAHVDSVGVGGVRRSGRDSQDEHREQQAPDGHRTRTRTLFE
jgi:hypothetical protein